MLRKVPCDGPQDSLPTSAQRARTWPCEGPMGGGWAYIRRAGGLGHSIPEGSRGQITGAEFFNAAELFERRHDRHARRDTDALFAVAAPTFRHLRLRFTPAALGVGAGGGGGRGVAWVIVAASLGTWCYSPPEQLALLPKGPLALTAPAECSYVEQWQPSPTSSSLAEVVGVQCASVRATRPTSGGKSVQVSSKYSHVVNVLMSSCVFWLVRGLGLGVTFQLLVAVGRITRWRLFDLTFVRSNSSPPFSTVCDSPPRFSRLSSHFGLSSGSQLSASHRVLTNRGRTGRNRRQETPSPEEASTQGREQKQSEVWANKSRPGVKRKHGESVIRGVVDDEKQGTSAIIPI